MKHSSLSNYEETHLRASRAGTLTPRPPLIVSWGCEGEITSLASSCVYFSAGLVILEAMIEFVEAPLRKLVTCYELLVCVVPGFFVHDTPISAPISVIEQVVAEWLRRRSSDSR